MKLSDAILRVQRQFGDESEAQITVADIVRWLNDAKVDIARKTAFASASHAFNTVAQQEEYDLPDDFLRERKVSCDGYRLQKSTLEELDQEERTRAAVGKPQFFYLVGEEIFLYPIPSSVQPVKLIYVQRPEDQEVPGDLNNQLNIPIAWHEDAIRYALARAKELDDDYSAARQLQEDYEIRLVQSRDEANNPHQSFGAVRALPGDD